VNPIAPAPGQNRAAEWADLPLRESLIGVNPRIWRNAPTLPAGRVLRWTGRGCVSPIRTGGPLFSSLRVPPGTLQIRRHNGVQQHVAWPLSRNPAGRDAVPTRLDRPSEAAHDGPSSRSTRASPGGNDSFIENAPGWGQVLEEATQEEAHDGAHPNN